MSKYFKQTPVQKDEGNVGDGPMKDGMERSEGSCGKWCRTILRQEAEEKKGREMSFDIVMSMACAPCLVAVAVK